MICPSKFLKDRPQIAPPSTQTDIPVDTGITSGCPEQLIAEDSRVSDNLLGQILS
jgi:hypothetical protein